MAKAIYDTRDRQMIPLDDIQHVNASWNKALKDDCQTMTILYKSGIKVVIPAIEYEGLLRAWEERRHGR